MSLSACVSTAAPVPFPQPFGEPGTNYMFPNLCIFTQCKLGNQFLGSTFRIEKKTNAPVVTMENDSTTDPCVHSELKLPSVLPCVVQTVQLALVGSCCQVRKERHLNNM